MNENDPCHPRRPFQLKKRIHSFGYAFRGVARMIQCQHNAWIHAVATVAVLGTGIAVRLSRADWCWVILAISIVWTAEAFNTAIEFLADAVTLETNPLIRDAKDVAAGAVLITAIAAAVVGVIVFSPYVVKLL